MRTVVVSLFFILGACAAQNESSPAPAAAQAPALDIDQFIHTVDVNHDGRMTHDEWLGVGLPESAFGVLDKDQDDAVSTAEMHAEAPPSGIDLNGDHVLTLQEFLEFDRRMSANMPPQQQ